MRRATRFCSWLLVIYYERQQALKYVKFITIFNVTEI